MKSVLDANELETMHTAQAEEFAASWPFPVTNGERNLESQKLLDIEVKICDKIKIDLNNEQDALL